MTNPKDIKFYNFSSSLFSGRNVVGALSLLGTLLVFADTAHTQCTELIPSGTGSVDRQNPIVWRIDISPFSSVYNVSGAQGLYAFSRALETYNDRMNGQTHQLLGTTNNAYGCSGYSALTVSNENSPVLAIVHPKCTWGGIGGVVTEWRIILFAFNENGTQRIFDVTPPFNGIDLTAVLTHEVGHTAGLGHPELASPVPPNPVTGSIMATGYESSAGRDPYAYDYECMFDDIASSFPRQMAIKNRFTSSGVLAPETTWSGSWNVSSANPGLVYTGVGNQNYWSAAVRKKYSCSVFTRGLDTANTTPCLSIPNEVGGDFEHSLFREDKTLSYIWYVGNTDYNTGSTSAPERPHRLKYLRSSSMFATASTGFATQCTNAGTLSWTSCNQTGYINTAHKPSIAWLNGNQGSQNPNGVTVFLYLLQDRSEQIDGTIKVAVGKFPVVSLLRYTPSTPLSVGAAIASPGLACRNNAAGGTYDCVVVYTPRNTDDIVVQSRRFSVSPLADRYSITWDPVSYTPASYLRTSNRIAAWHQSGYFWLAVRYYTGSANGHQIIVMRSTDGASWSPVTFNAGLSMVGPSSDPTRHWDNTLSYLR